jgi:hypothetical protein
MSKIVAFGMFAVTLGLLLIFCGLYCEEALKPERTIFLVGLKLLDHIGIAAISIGLITMILELRDWQQYFQTRLVETILNRNYLETMSKDELIDLRTKTIEAFFKIKNLAKEGSFLQYFDDKIHNFIGGPYREDLEMHMAFSDPDAQGNLFTVHETLSYVCRKMGDHIQPEVNWGSTLPYEVAAINDFSIEIKVPQNFFQSPNFQTEFPDFLNPTNVYKPAAAHAGVEEPNSVRVVPWEHGLGYRFPLAKFREIDGLYVKVVVKYTVPKDTLHTWTMSHCSKNVNVTLSFPDCYDIHVDNFGTEEAVVDQTMFAGMYTFKYNSWLLPVTGIAFHLVHRPTAAA